MGIKFSILLLIYVREFEIEAYLPKFIYTTISLNNLITIGNETLQLQILP
jgi:hypothetical protein